jgi:hypothetical protein
MLYLKYKEGGLRILCFSTQNKYVFNGFTDLSAIKELEVKRVLFVVIDIPGYF